MQENSIQTPPPKACRKLFKDFAARSGKALRAGHPGDEYLGQELTTFLWVIGVFIVVMLIVGIVVAIARYVSETAVIRMVDEYEDSGNKMTVRQGFRIGWSRTAWRLFLINLIVNLPVIAWF